MFNEATVVKALNFERMTKSSLPKGWCLVKFGDLAESITERVDDPKASGVEIYVGLEHLDSDTTKISRYGTPDDVESTKLRFYPGDVIYARRRAYQRKLGVAEVEGICSAHALVLRARPDVCLREFLPYFLQSNQFHDRALSISVGSLSPTINWKTLVGQEFVLPPIAEQRRIVLLAKRLQLVHEAFKIALYENRSFRVSFMNEVCQDRKTVKLKERLQILTKGTTPTSVGENFSEDGVPFVKAENIMDGFLDFSRRTFISIATDDELSRSRILPSDVLLTIAGTIGRSAVVGQELPRANCNQAVAILRPLESLNSFFLSEWLTSADAVRQILIGQVSNTISNLSLGTISELNLPLLSSDEQTLVVETLTRIRDLHTSLLRTIAQVKVCQSSCFEMLADRTINV